MAVVQCFLQRGFRRVVSVFPKQVCLTAACGLCSPPNPLALPLHRGGHNKAAIQEVLRVSSLHFVPWLDIAALCAHTRRWGPQLAHLSGSPGP